MSSPLFLVTAAVGATGRETSRLLLSRGHRVRAFVRSSDERSDELKALGAEIFVGDLLDFASVRSAIDGVQAAYFCYIIAPGILDATSYFAQAALEAGVSYIVNMSQMSAVREATSTSALNHWISERVFDHYGVPVTHIRPGFFAECTHCNAYLTISGTDYRPSANFLCSLLCWPACVGVLYFKAMIQGGTVSLPFTSSVHAPIAADDQARVIAALMEAPAAHIGKVYPLSGPVLMTFEESFRITGAVLNKPITYRVISLEQYAAMWKGLGCSDFFVQHIVEVAKAHMKGGFSILNDEVERITGQRPMTVAEFVEKNKAQLTDTAPAKARNRAQ